MKEWLDTVQIYEQDNVFKVKTQSTSDSPFAFPIEGVVLLGVPLINKGLELPDGVVPVAVLEGGFFEGVNRLIGRFVRIEVPDPLAALIEYKIPFEGYASRLTAIS